ncbi:uncharacterized protein LOC143879817 [Tasmannia lanceolata]|uniref:uncharacterized protein LOC143879817 n=1 Tax=Tasmannia lanceolata TaxID=3420 RepID=UPI0040636480
MEFFKLKKFRKGQNLNEGEDTEDNQARDEESKNENGNDLPTTNGADSAGEIEEDEDDFISNEIKRRLKELRNKNFMVLIPEEETYPEEEEEEEMSSSDWRESEVGDRYPWCGFDTLYDKYCERMLFFDKMSAQLLQDAGSWNPPNPSPRSASKKLASTLRSLSFKKREDLQDGSELLPQQDEPYHDLETVYVAQICLTWEALHCQYTQLSQKISSQPENPTCYSHVAQQFQQFQVLLQRFIESEPFEPGNRVEIYARTRHSLPKLVQVPSIQGLDQKEKDEEDPDYTVLAADLIRIMEDSILTFRFFLKMDRKKTGSVLNLFGGNQVASSLQQVHTSLDKKEIKLKELRRKKNGRKKSWPSTPEEVELLFGLIDIKVVFRVLRMARISKEQLLWCEEKMSKLDVSESKLQRDGSPVLFPC